MTPVTVLRDLVRDALDDHASAFNSVALQAMTDDELWSVLLHSPSTQERARLFRRNPAAWQLLKDGHEPKTKNERPLDHLIARGYLSLPTTEGELSTDPEIQELIRELPARYRIVREAA